MSFFAEIIDSLYPRRCACCRSYSNQEICDNCKPEHRSFEEECPRCSEPADDFECDACKLWPLPFETVRSLWNYSGAAEHAVKAFKYSGERQLASIFAGMMAFELRQHRIHREFDLIVPVPSTLLSLRQRGYGHMALVARALGERLAVESDVFALDTVQERAPQASLSRESRILNMRNQMKASDVKGRRILVIDDVLTTGASLWASGVALRRAGAATTFALTLARSEQFPKSRRLLFERLGIS